MPTLVKPIIQKIYKKKKSRSGKTTFNKKLVGNLIAGVIDGEVGIGYSLVHKNDRYDFINGRREPGFGLDLAMDRAIKSRTTGQIKIPPSIMPLVTKFAERCERYYKDLERPVLLTQEVEFPRDFFIECPEEM